MGVDFSAQLVYGIPFENPPFTGVEGADEDDPVEGATDLLAAYFNLGPPPDKFDEVYWNKIRNMPVCVIESGFDGYLTYALAINGTLYGVSDREPVTEIGELETKPEWATQLLEVCKTFNIEVKSTPQWLMMFMVN